VVLRSVRIQMIKFLKNILFGFEPREEKREGAGDMVDELIEKHRETFDALANAEECEAKMPEMEEVFRGYGEWESLTPSEKEEVRKFDSEREYLEREEGE
jgi:hypothetical protein